MQKIKALAHLVLALSALIFSASFAIQTMRPSYTIHRVGQGPLIVRLNSRTGEAHVAIARPEPTPWRLIRESAVDALLANKEEDNDESKASQELSADEIRKKYGLERTESDDRGTEPQELSADEILKKYGVDAPEDQRNRSESPDRGTEPGGDDSSTR